MTFRETKLNINYEEKIAKFNNMKMKNLNSSKDI